MPAILQRGKQDGGKNKSPALHKHDGKPHQRWVWRALRFARQRACNRTEVQRRPSGKTNGGGRGGATEAWRLDRSLCGCQRRTLASC